MGYQKRLIETRQCDEIENDEQYFCDPHELTQLNSGMFVCIQCGMQLTPHNYQMFGEPYVLVEPTTKGMND